MAAQDLLKEDQQEREREKKTKRKTRGASA